MVIRQLVTYNDYTLWLNLSIRQTFPHQTLITVNSPNFLAAKLSRYTVFPLTTSRTHTTFHEVIYNYKTAGTHYCTCLHLAWNVVVTQIVYAFHSIEKKVMNGRIKESPWHNRKTVFGITIL